MFAPIDSCSIARCRRRRRCRRRCHCQRCGAQRERQLNRAKETVHAIRATLLYNNYLI